jgi:hypothetical protein
MVAFVTLAGCGPAIPSGGIASAEEAATLVLAQREDFAGIGPFDPNLIGQADWYRVEAAGDGWQVLVRIGWDDCEAGCISEHRWVYQVGRDGSVELLSEQGDELPATR